MYDLFEGSIPYEAKRSYIEAFESEFMFYHAAEVKFVQHDVVLEKLHFRRRLFEYFYDETDLPPELGRLIIEYSMVLDRFCKDFLSRFKETEYYSNFALITSQDGT
jgi:hypothetical protein